MSNEADTEMHRYEREMSELRKDVHHLQEWLGQAEDESLIEKLARALEEKEKRLELATANLLGWQMVREGRSLLRALSQCQVPASMVRAITHLEDAVDAWEGVRRCSACRDVFEDLIECESEFDYDRRCPDCHANGTRPEHRGLGRDGMCAECVFDLAAEEAADLSPNEVH